MPHFKFNLNYIIYTKAYNASGNIFHYQNQGISFLNNISTTTVIFECKKI